MKSRHVETPSKPKSRHVETPSKPKSSRLQVPFCMHSVAMTKMKMAFIRKLGCGLLKELAEIAMSARCTGNGSIRTC
jgi:hypothetical protein